MVKRIYVACEVDENAELAQGMTNFRWPEHGAIWKPIAILEGLDTMNDLEKQLAERLAETESIIQTFLNQEFFDCPYCEMPRHEGHKKNCIILKAEGYLERYYGKRIR